MAGAPNEIAILADSILLVHFAVVLFITAGLPLIYLGAAAGWSWVREWRWRALHLAAILYVATESMLGLACPLTVWEDALRGHRAGDGFIERWIGRILFYDLPARVFLVAYTGFALLVVVAWVIVPPAKVGRETRVLDRRAAWGGNVAAASDDATMNLDAKQLIAAARQQTGLINLGDDAILEGLNRLVDALNSEAKLTERGQKTMEGIIVSTLTNRLRVQDYLARHPGVLERPVERPMFVFGLPRTGTTLVINLLNEDPARRSLLRWEAFNSVPPPKAGELSTDPRCLAEQARLDMSLKHMPQISAIHHEDADSPTECQFAMSPSFCAQYFEAVAQIPSYGKWLLQADYLPAFRYHKRLLQLLQSEAPGRWTLKNPWHPLFLNALTTVYPDAQLVMTHRDPVNVVGSACSLIKHVRAMFSDQVDPEDIAKTVLNTFDTMIERTLAYLQRHGSDAIYHLQYDALMRDPIGETRRLYFHFDEPFTPAAEAAMTAFLASNPKGKHGRHAYSLEQFGLTKEQMREHFADYCERFGIPQQL